MIIKQQIPAKQQQIPLKCKQQNDRRKEMHSFDVGMKSMDDAETLSPGSSFQILCTAFQLMRFKPRFSAILQPQRTAGNR